MVFKLWSVPSQLLALRGFTNEEIKYNAEYEFKVRFSKGYLEDSSDMTTVAKEEEEVHGGQHRNVEA